jgi:hypothetical protein
MIDLGAIDDLTYQRAKRAIGKRIRELRACGLMVTVVEDYDIAVLVDARPDGEPPFRMLVDPLVIISPKIRELRRRAL